MDAKQANGPIYEKDIILVKLVLKGSKDEEKEKHIINDVPINRIVCITKLTNKLQKILEPGNSEPNIPQQIFVRTSGQLELLIRAIKYLLYEELPTSNQRDVGRVIMELCDMETTYKYCLRCSNPIAVG